MPAAEPPFSDPIMRGLVDLFALYMGLDETQAMIYNQDWRIPNDNRLYLTLVFTGARPFGAATNFEEGSEKVGEDTISTLNEVVTVNTQETYTVNLWSKTFEARQRGWEIEAALNATIGQQLQERLGFRLAALPVSVIDLSGVEATNRLFRSATTFNLLRARARKTRIESFNDFTGQPALVIEP